jgi:hypothetical protein
MSETKSLPELLEDMKRIQANIRPFLKTKEDWEQYLAIYEKGNKVLADIVQWYRDTYPELVSQVEGENNE